jgi:hypothetical protein
MKDTQPILIISTGRTGTIFFSRLFADLYPVAASYHERGASRPIQILTNLHFSHLFPKRGLTTAWKFFKGREIETCKQQFHIDANCFLYGLAPLAPELYPNLKVVHIVRDPRAYVTSHLNFSRQKGTSFIANYFVPFWQPDPFIVSLENSSTPYLRVRFEDLFNTNDPQKLFGRITDFIGLPRITEIKNRFHESANTSTKADFPAWPQWTSEQAAQLNWLCGERMHKYGYGGEPAWLEKLGQKQ